jgi:hypothetical protein
MAYDRGAGAQAPWLTQRANELLDQLLVPTHDIGIEWGSGRSTAWFGKRLKHLTSIEHEPRWYDAVRGQIAGLTNVDYQLLDAPDSDDSPYVTVIDRFADASLDFALVDGVLRERCIMAVLPKIAVGGILCLDNAGWYLDRPSHGPGNRHGKGPLLPIWGQFERRVSGWRHIWTTSGLSDTALWIRIE